MILTSRTYRQALRRDPKHQELDPDNRLFGGARLRRVEAEVLRDSILAVSGRLNSKPFGPPVPVMADMVGQWVIGIENLNAGRPGAVISMQGEEFRRSIYVQVRRSRPLAVLDTFDAPRMEPHCEARSTSTVAPQSLMLMNGTFPLEQANHFADRILKEAGDDPAAQIELAWKLAYCRVPNPTEYKTSGSIPHRANPTTRRPSRQEDQPHETRPRELVPSVVRLEWEFLYVD